MNQNENLRSHLEMRHLDYSISVLSGLGFAMYGWPLTVDRWPLAVDRWPLAVSR